MIDLNGVSVSYGSVQVVRPMSLSIDKGEFFTLLGPSGCGKTTVLRAIAGFVPVAGGSVSIDGKDVTALPPERRDVGIVFQNYALFPHMTVSDNIAFGLKVAGKSRADRTYAVDRILEITGISAHRNRKPAELSGGQQQRVAIARSLVMGTQVLLFDEPLSNLDAGIREDMRHEIKALQRELGFTAVFVTHDQEEALSMSDRLLVLNAGRVEQIGTARDLYENPATPFVCQFVGIANRIGPGLAGRLGLGDADPLFVRPEHVKLRVPTGSGTFDAIVKDLDYLGPITRVMIDVNGEVLRIQSFSDPATAALKPGDAISVSLDIAEIHRFGT